MEEAEGLAVASLRKDDYVPWDDPIPAHYTAGPREFFQVDIAIQGKFALYQPKPEARAPHWALRLSGSPQPGAVVLFMGPEMDQIPGVGPVFRGGPGDEALLKIYANNEPWLKIGRAEDVEVSYPIPQIVKERSATVINKLEPHLGGLAEDFKVALKRCLEDDSPSAEKVLAALGLSRVFPVSDRTLRFIRRDSPLFRNAPPSPTERGNQ